MKNCIKADAVSLFNATGITGSFQAMNPLGFSGPAVLIRMVNDCDQPIAISYDGSHTHDYLAENSSMILPLQTNGLPNNNVAAMKKGTVVYISGAKGAGYISLSVYYLES